MVATAFQTPFALSSSWLQLNLTFTTKAGQMLASLFSSITKDATVKAQTTAAPRQFLPTTQKHPSFFEIPSPELLADLQAYICSSDADTDEERSLSSQSSDTSLESDHLVSTFSDSTFDEDNSFLDDSGYSSDSSSECDKADSFLSEPAPDAEEIDWAYILAQTALTVNHEFLKNTHTGSIPCHTVSPLRNVADEPKLEEAQTALIIVDESNISLTSGGTEFDQIIDSNLDSALFPLTFATDSSSPSNFSFSWADSTESDDDDYFSTPPSFSSKPVVASIPESFAEDDRFVDISSLRRPLPQRRRRSSHYKPEAPLLEWVLRYNHHLVSSARR